MQQTPENPSSHSPAVTDDGSENDDDFHPSNSLAQNQHGVDHSNDDMQAGGIESSAGYQANELLVTPAAVP